MTDSVNAGAPSTGGAFPGTNPLLAPFDIGETMAEARGRAMCGPTRACAPSVNIVFDDYWQPNFDPMTTPGSFDMCYIAGASSVLSNPADLTQRHICTGGLTTLPPTTAQCGTAWNSLCRITINYEQHIHLLWGVDRFVDANDDGVNDVDGNGADINHKCTACHGLVDAANAAQVPAGQLDLTDGPSDDEPDHFKSYRELLFGDTELELVGGALVERLVVVGTDPVTNLPITEAVPVAASMSAAGARSSARFFNKVEGRGGGTVNHRDFMSPSELRLLSEWLDIGAQYYNDPFAAPED